MKLMGKIGEINVLVGDEVAGAISAELIDVPWDKAFQALLDMKNYASDVDVASNLIRIHAPETLTAQENYKSERAQAVKKKVELEDSVEPIYSEIFRLYYISPQQAKATIEELFQQGSGDGGFTPIQITEEVTTRSIIVRGKSEDLDVVNKIIGEIETHLKDNIGSVIKLKRLLNKNEQAEFSDPAKYFNKKLISQKTKVGKKYKKSLQKILENIENLYEVDRHFLLAIWANETFFGRVRPRLDSLQVLSLLSFSSSNRLVYLNELIYLIDFAIENEINIKYLKASKAGALGQPQFLPSTLVKLAVDFDNDGNIDIYLARIVPALSRIL